MAFVLADRVLETSISTGTGSFVLAGARDGYQSFTDALNNGDTTYYTITDGTDWEVGLGTWTESTVTLARTTVFSSSNSGSAVNFGAGTKEVFISYPSDKFAEDTTAALLKSGGTMTGNLVVNASASVDELSFNKSLSKRFSTYYTGTNYITAGEYQKIATVTPGGNSQNTYLRGIITAQSGQYIQECHFVASLRSNTLPDLSFTIVYHENMTSIYRYIDLQLWTKETSPASFVLVAKGLSTIYGNITADFEFIPRFGSQDSTISVNEDPTSEVSSIDTGFTANDFTKITQSQAASFDVTGNITVSGTVDGRDLATDGTKLDGVEASADVTDTANVTAAGALMDSEVTNLAQVKAFDSSDYATAAQGTTADNALPKAGGTMTGNLIGTQATASQSWTELSRFFANPAAENGEQTDIRLINDLAGLNKWGTETLTDIVTSHQGTTARTTLGDAAYDGTSSTINLYQNANGDPNVILLELPHELEYSCWVGIVFGATNWRSKSVKIETFRNGAWQTECDLTNQPDHIIARQVANNGAQGVTKIRYTLDDYQNTSSNYTRIHSLFAVNYRAGNNAEGGVHYLSRFKDDEHYSNIAPAIDSTYALGTSSKRYSNVYSDALDVAGNIAVSGTVNVNGAYTLPTSDGSANQVLQTDGSGTLSFADAGGSESFTTTTGYSTSIDNFFNLDNDWKMVELVVANQSTSNTVGNFFAEYGITGVDTTIQFTYNRILSSSSGNSLLLTDFLNNRTIDDMSSGGASLRPAGVFFLRMTRRTQNTTDFITYSVHYPDTQSRFVTGSGVRNIALSSNQKFIKIYKGGGATTPISYAIRVYT